jgi:DNA-binding NarL/FixJ family response regulator
LKRRIVRLRAGDDGLHMTGSAPREVRQGVTCLLADDSEPILEALVDFLRNEGIEILGAARTGVEALRLLERCDPTVFVLDVRLPDLGGVEVARRAGEIARRKPAVILYTSYPDRGLATRALAVGARAVVLKDVPPANLLEAIAVVVDGGIYIDPRLGVDPTGHPG